MSVSELWTIGFAIAGVGVVAVASGHAVLHKTDTRAAISWVGVIVALPFLGALLYWLLGINRVKRRACEMFRERELQYPPPRSRSHAAEVMGEHAALRELAHLMDRVTVFPLLDGNRVTPLHNGDEAYPAMLRALDQATRSISLATYIFDPDCCDHRFVDSLARAHERGVEVRILVDAVGARYSFPSAIGVLRRRGLHAGRFNRTLLPWRWTYANLRNHRKLLICDGRIAFTGGLNIRSGHVLSEPHAHPIVDLHFQLEGPIAAQMQIAFAEDWSFATGERLSGDRWFPQADPRGDVFARALIDGPDVDLNKLRWTFLGAINCARRRVRIVTPYFLPDNDLVAALKLACLRGVNVELLLPRKNNQILVRWACDAALPQVIDCGVRVFKTEGPFDHTKVMVVDEGWTLFGSANLDPRSLRLNFELNVECYDPELATKIHALIDSKLAHSQQISSAELRGRPLPSRLRDGVARLFTPYL